MNGVEDQVPEHELARLRRSDVTASIQRSHATFSDSVKERDSASLLRRDLAFVRRKVRLIPEKVYQTTHRSTPWLSQGAVRYLDRHLDQHGAGFEFGSGKSTAWLAQRLGSLTSVEHDSEWYEKVHRRLTDFPNAQVVLRSDEGEESSAYVGEALKVADGTLSFALVDGRLRMLCVVALLPKMAQGGLFAVDDSWWPGYSAFLSETIPWERVHESRNARTQTTIWTAS